MVGNNSAGYPAVLTYKQAALVQPFANTLVNMQMTGAQIKTLLEQQWQRDAAGNIPSRPFLRLGTSEGFRFTYDPTRPEGDRITGMWLNGEPIGLATSYSVTVNSFLASGGDNFRGFTAGTQKRDTGKVDLQAMVDYMDEFANAQEGDAPLPVDYQQHAFGVSFVDGEPETFIAGGGFDVDLSSLAFTAPPDARDTEVDVRLDGRSIGTFPVDNTIGTAVFDEYGKAAVRATIPADTNEGPAVVRIVGNNTGSLLQLPIEVAAGQDTTVTGTDTTMTWGQAGSVPVQVSPSVPAGMVTLLRGDQELGSTSVTGGTGTIALAARSLEPGTYRLTLRYSGAEGFRSSTGFVNVTVQKAAARVFLAVSPTTLKVKKDVASITVTLEGAAGTPTGFVAAYVDGVLQDVVEVAAGKATLKAGPFDTVGTKSLTVRYLGDAFHEPATSAPTSLTVQKERPKR
jgi:hypothetical protein